MTPYCAPFSMQAANSLLNVVRRAHPLKDWARRIKRRSSHKFGLRGVGPQAGRFLHRMMATGEAFRWPPKEESATA